MLCLNTMRTRKAPSSLFVSTPWPLLGSFRDHSKRACTTSEQCQGKDKNGDDEMRDACGRGFMLAVKCKVLFRILVYTSTPHN